MLQEEYRAAHHQVRQKFETNRHAMPVTSETISLMTKKENCAGLELADILAHPCKQGLLRQEGLIPDKTVGFCESLLQVLEEKFENVRELRGTVII